MNIKTIAEHFNTSVSVVSRALNDSGYVSAAKRQKIKEFAALHHYQPSPAAKQLKQGTKNLIGVITPWVLRNQMDFISLLLNELYNSDQAWQLVVGNNETCVEQLSAMPVEKIIAFNITSEQYPAIRRAADKNIAVLNVMGHCEDIPGIRVTHEKALYDCVKHLTDTGHRRLMYVGMNIFRPLNNLHRYYLKMAIQGLQQAAAEENISFEKNINIFCSDEYYNFDQTKLEAMLADYRPDGIIAWTEQAEASVYAACHALQLQIPDDISVIGLGGNSMLRGFYPQLAHYRFDYEKILAAVKEFIVCPAGEYSGHRAVDCKFYPGESIKSINN